jgi:O-antigen/teichoic acid export membrane protein
MGLGANKAGLRDEEPAADRRQARMLGLQVAKGAGTALFGMITGQGLSFLLTVLLARILGASVFGVYALALSVLEFAASVSLLGLQGGIVKFVAAYNGLREAGRLKAALLSALTLPFATASVLGTGIFLVAPWIATNIFHNPQMTDPLRAMAIGIPFYTTMMIASFSARAFKAIGYEMFLKNLFQPIATGVFVGFAFLMGAKLWGAIYGTLAGYVLSASVGLFLVSKLCPQLTSGVRAWFEVRKLLRFSLPLSVIFMAVRISDQLNRMILGVFSPTADVGMYTAAAKIGAQLSLFLLAINTIMGPMVSDAFAREDPHALETLFKMGARWALMFTIPAFCLSIYWAQPLMRLLGSEFLAGSSALVIICASRLFGAANGSNGIVLQMTERQDLDMINNLAALLVNVILNGILVGNLGVLGIAIGTATATVFVNIIKTIEIYFLLGMHPFSKGYLKPWVAGGLAAIGMLLPLRGFRASDGLTPRIIGTVIFLGVYIGALWLLGLESIDRDVFSAFRTRVVPKYIRKSFTNHPQETYDPPAGD